MKLGVNIDHIATLRQARMTNEPDPVYAAALAEWKNGFRLGGFTSRGLGQVKLEETKVEQVDYGSPEQLKAYLLKRQMTPVDRLLENSLEKILNTTGGTDAEKTH